ncbi:uncharacterized protein LOC142231409 [Haematobia irritans]|uniref:uncharacterized protein LOC142231409 n=1 Tax=Haematobia irritans TaxID=7368 RepID=UPI003F508999
MWLKLVLCGIFVVTNVVCQTKSYTHENLPPLFKLHNYDEAIFSPEPNSYCLVFAEIQPNNSSKLWESIANYSRDWRRRFRRDYLFLGLNVQKCKEILDTKTFDLKNRTNVNDNMPQNEVTNIYKRLYARDTNNERILYQEILHNCANQEFQQDYNLSVKTFVEYCESTNGKDGPQKDPIEKSVYIILGSLVLLNIFSFIYDKFNKSQNKTSTSQEIPEVVKKQESSGNYTIYQIL